MRSPHEAIVEEYREGIRSIRVAYDKEGNLLSYSETEEITPGGWKGLAGFEEFIGARNGPKYPIACEQA